MCWVYIYHYSLSLHQTNGKKTSSEPPDDCSLALFSLSLSLSWLRYSSSTHTCMHILSLAICPPSEDRWTCAEQRERGREGCHIIPYYICHTTLKIKNVLKLNYYLLKWSTKLWQLKALNMYQGCLDQFCVLEQTYRFLHGCLKGVLPLFCH